jgi:hypothetical protein
VTRRLGERGACFAPGTLVVAAGGMTPIEKLQPGDQVWSRDEATGEEGLRAIVTTFVIPDQALIRLSLRDDAGRIESLDVTPPHPFHVDGRGWVPAGRLEVGDRVHTRRGAVRVVGAMPTGRARTVYNFEVEGTHTYFVGQGAAWVHNDCHEPRSIHGNDGAIH